MQRQLHLQVVAATTCRSSCRRKHGRRRIGWWWGWAVVFGSVRWWQEFLDDDDPCRFSLLGWFGSWWFGLGMKVGLLRWLWTAPGGPVGFSTMAREGVADAGWWRAVGTRWCDGARRWRMVERIWRWDFWSYSFFVGTLCFSLCMKRFFGINFFWCSISVFFFFSDGGLSFLKKKVE